MIRLLAEVGEKGKGEGGKGKTHPLPFALFPLPNSCKSHFCKSSIHFTSLNAFWRLHKLPVWFRRFVKDSLFGAAQKLLDGLVRQDVQQTQLLRFGVVIEKHLGKKI